LAALINLCEMQQELGNLAMAHNYLRKAYALAQKLGDNEQLTRIERLEAMLSKCYRSDSEAGR